MSEPIQFIDLFALLNQDENIEFKKLPPAHPADYQIRMTHIGDSLEIRNSLLEITNKQVQGVKTKGDLRSLIFHLRKLLYR